MINGNAHPPPLKVVHFLVVGGGCSKKDPLCSNGSLWRAVA